jgi:hypothetical protein
MRLSHNTAHAILPQKLLVEATECNTDQGFEVDGIRLVLRQATL